MISRVSSLSYDFSVKSLSVSANLSLSISHNCLFIMFPMLDTLRAVVCAVLLAISITAHEMTRFAKVMNH